MSKKEIEKAIELLKINKACDEYENNTSAVHLYIIAISILEEYLENM